MNTVKTALNGFSSEAFDLPMPIPKSMHAIVLSASKNTNLHNDGPHRVCDYHSPLLQIKSVSVPLPGATEVLIRLLCVSVCGSDYHALACDSAGNLGSSVPANGLEFGRILGHEFAAQVVAIGSNVDSVQKGSLVTGDSVYCCRSLDCDECSHQLHNHCPRSMLNGFNRDGVFAEFASVPAASLTSIESLSSRFGTDATVVATQAEPLGVAAKAFGEAMTISHRVWDQSVLILGAGPIGYYCALIARAHGFGPITIVEPNVLRRQWATKVAEQVFHPNELFEVCSGDQPSKKYSFVFECCGDAPLEKLPSLIQPGGVLTLLARNDQQMMLDVDALVTNGIEVVGTRGHIGYVPAMVELMRSGQLDPRPFITRRLRGLDELYKWLAEPSRFFNEGKVVCELPNRFDPQRRTGVSL